MKSVSVARSILVLAYLIFVTFSVSGCYLNSSLANLGSESQNGNSKVTSLEFERKTELLVSSQTFQFTATGGSPPYVFSLASGNGNISSSTGVFTPLSGNPGDVVVLVTDSKGISKQTTLAIIDPLSFSKINFVTASGKPGNLMSLDSKVLGGKPPY